MATEYVAGRAQAEGTDGALVDATRAEFARSMSRNARNAGPEPLAALAAAATARRRDDMARGRLEQWPALLQHPFAKEWIAKDV